MNVLVVGGSGFVGSAVCKAFVEREHDVTALSRSPDPDELPGGVETAAGDVTAYDSIVDHFEGVDVAVNLVALSPLYKPPSGLSHDLVHTEGTRNVVDACERHDVAHLIQQSALGADSDGPTAYIRSKGDAEAIVRESDVAWTILRPSVIFGEGGEFVEFTKQLSTSIVAPLPGGGTNEFQPMWIEDFAPLVVDAAESDTHRGAVYEIGGPEALSMRDVTVLAWRAVGKNPALVSLPKWFMKTGLTVAGPIPFFPFGPDQARALDVQNTVEDNDIDAFGVDPEDLRTLEDYLGVDELDVDD